MGAWWLRSKSKGKKGAWSLQSKSKKLNKSRKKKEHCGYGANRKKMEYTEQQKNGAWSFRSKSENLNKSTKKKEHGGCGANRKKTGTKSKLALFTGWYTLLTPLPYGRLTAQMVGRFPDMIPSKQTKQHMIPAHTYQSWFCRAERELQLLILIGLDSAASCFYGGGYSSNVVIRTKYGV